MKNKTTYITRLCLVVVLSIIILAMIAVSTNVIPFRSALTALVNKSTGNRLVTTTPETTVSQTAATVDLHNYTLVLEDTFDTALSVYNGKTGIWNVDSRRENLVTNGPQSVFLSQNTKTTTGSLVGINPFRVTNGILHIESGVIPAAKKAAVADALRLVGQADSIPKVNYYTGMLNMHDTLGQAFGYYEIKAKIPKGKGHWPAFWLTPSTIGWPPEIDIFEAYGKGVAKSTGADNEFHTSSFFDKVDIAGNATQNVSYTNQFDITASGTPRNPNFRTKGGGEQYQFTRSHNALTELNADIYEQFWVYAAKWTPTDITFYFGPDSNSLVQIFKTPTPPDLTSPMSVIINDQISTDYGWNPVPGFDNLTFAPDNTFQIDYVKIYALNPTAQLRGSGIGADIVDTAASTMIRDTAGSDRIVSGGGADMITLSSGADSVFVKRDIYSQMISGFGSDDTLVLEGMHIADANDALSKLTQVNGDVWLINGADTTEPQTIIFKNKRVENFTAKNFVSRWPTTKFIWGRSTANETKLADIDSNGSVEAVSSGSKLTDAGGSFLGAKTLRGGLAGDLYFIYSTQTNIAELQGGGVDTVHAYRNYTLPNNVENIISEAKTPLVFIGNALNNRIEGGQGNETFSGKVGDDYLVLGTGADTIMFASGEGNDAVLGFGTDDVIELQNIPFANFTQLKQRLLQVGKDVMLKLGSGDSVTLRNSNLEQLVASNFTFIVGEMNLAGSGVDVWYQPSQSGKITRGIDGNPKPTPVPQVGGGNGTTTSSPSPTIKGKNGISNNLIGTSLDDVIAGREGADELYGYAGNDLLNGGGGDDVLVGGMGNDRLVGWTGNDRLRGDEGADTLIAGDGNDILIGGAGADKLTGGIGADAFICTDFAAGVTDSILDFAVAEGDTLDISSLFTVLVAERSDTIKITQNGVKFTLSIDRDGGGPEALIAVLTIVATDTTTIEQIMSVLKK